MQARFPSTSVHWIQPGYIKGQFREPVCGIADKVDNYTSVDQPELKSRITCEHCLYWLWDQEQPARKMDVDQRVVSMSFDNRGLSAHDTEKAIQRGTEAAIARGIREGLAKVALDFRTTKPELERMVSDGVERALQRGTVKQNLVGIHKIAEDEIDDEIAEDRKREIREVLEAVLEERDDQRNPEADISRLHNAIYDLFNQEGFKRRIRSVAKDGAEQALKEQAGAGVGTQFVQNVYTPEAVTPEQLWRKSFLGEESQPGATVVNIVAEVEPESFKEMVTEAARKAIDDDNDENDAEYADFHLAQGQKAISSVIASDQFQDLIKKLVKVALDERDRDINRSAIEWNLAWYDRALPPVIQLPVVHHRKLYTQKLWCGRDIREDTLYTTWSRDVTCQECKTRKGNN